MREEFKVHKLNEAAMNRATLLAIKFDELATFISDSLQWSLHPIPTKGGRSFALAMTKLEEACFFAKKALAQNADEV